MTAMARQRATTVSVTEARTCLDDLLRRVGAGEEIVITRNHRPAARLIPAHRPGSRMPGSARGLITLAPDFDAPLGDFRSYWR